MARGYDIVRISRWTFDIFFNHRKYLTDEAEEILQYLFFMEEDPQFVLSEKELKLLTEMLINNKQDPIKNLYKI